MMQERWTVYDNGHPTEIFRTKERARAHLRSLVPSVSPQKIYDEVRYSGGGNLFSGGGGTLRVGRIGIETRP